MNKFATVQSSTFKYPTKLKASANKVSTYFPNSSIRFARYGERVTGKMHPGSVLASLQSSTQSYPRQEVVSSEDKTGTKRIAVVTGANRGIGFEITRQLAFSGVTVILTSRDEKRGSDAVNLLHREHNLSNILLHQLDICDPNSVDSLAKFIQTRFGKLDILVNNAGASGVVVDAEGLRALKIDPQIWTSGKAVDMIKEVMRHTYDEAVKCLDTNYYGCKRVTEALLPFLKLSTSGARIVNVSSLRSELKRMPSEELRRELSNIDKLDEKKLENLISTFLDDFKNGRLEAAGWPNMLPAYSVSKMVLNAYTRILAKRYPKMCINCVGPGFVNTEINWNTGVLTPEEGARGPVMLALLPEGGSTGCYFDQTVLAEAW
ncbi:NAD(P)-binding Rossmann-fold superfamily protein [Rhynchospora pubera]|uniref:NAD(P)-binding Rossmann-fold superfamily protein n=1 Tax=Rhynchospora pubera TaxID=906938 RepID=A0AAV8DBW6_9POAL|nr:NAD(P)-binding Rossmann-fold superfamily protein [Rhynchospora pubera]